MTGQDWGRGGAGAGVRVGSADHASKAPSGRWIRQMRRASKPNGQPFKGGPLRFACVSYCSTLGVSNHCSANRKASLPLFCGDPTSVRIEFSPVSAQQQQQKWVGSSPVLCWRHRSRTDRAKSRGLRTAAAEIEGREKKK